MTDTYLAPSLRDAGYTGATGTTPYKPASAGQIDVLQTVYTTPVPTTVQRRAAYRKLFRPQLDEEAASDIREALRLGMPLGNERFAEAVCARVGQRRNSGRRGRVACEPGQLRPRITEQRDFGF